MRTSTNPRNKSFRVCMDPETKERLTLYAGEQRKSVSQLITEWVWEQPVRADTDGKSMTASELQELTGREFAIIALDANDNIMFAAPIPGVDSKNFSANGSLVWDDEEISARREAWKKYVNTLPMYARRVINAGAL